MPQNHQLNLGRNQRVESGVETSGMVPTIVWMGVSIVSVSGLSSPSTGAHHISTAGERKHGERRSNAQLWTCLSILNRPPGH